ncbi:MAG: SRPBCC domain-containing protein [Bacteroidetes bacterium]|nr:SRPBCC domain-containing protein [Bacteroidota bacterium]
MKDFKKYYLLESTPEEVYQALTNPKSIELWTNEQAIMSTEEGSEFSIMGGAIEGKNLSFEENRKLVQQWYFGDETEDSIVTILLHPHAKGTSVEVRHTNIPDEAFDNITEGWNEVYFENLGEFLNE